MQVKYMNVKRWSDLNREEIMKYSIKFNMLMDFLQEHPNKKYRWENVDKVLPHIYKWTLMKYNDSLQAGEVVFDDEGMQFKI